MPEKKSTGFCRCSFLFIDIYLSQLTGLILKKIMFFVMYFLALKFDIFFVPVV